MSVRIITGDALTELAKLPAESVHCCVTSPPYFGLRDYGTAAWEGGDPACDHKAYIGASASSGLNGSLAHKDGRVYTPYRNICGKCGAQRIDAQLGLEATPDEYVAAMVGVFREVRRVLRSDGTLWLNLGTSYAGSWGAQGRKDGDAAGISTTQVRAAPSFGSLTGSRGVSGKRPIPSRQPQHAPACDNDGIEPRYSPGSGSACHGPDDVHQDGSLNHYARTADSAQPPQLFEPHHEQTSRDSELSGCAEDLASIALLAGRLSTNPALPENARDAFARATRAWDDLLHAPTSLADALEYVRRAACSRDSDQPESVSRNQDTNVSGLACRCDSCGFCFIRLAMTALRFKPKDEMNIPHLVALALQADGWFLRQTICWSKPNPMPESVTDRCTKAHEYLFLLSKSASYYYDAEAIKEPADAGSRDASPRKAEQAAGGIVDQRTAAGFARGVTWGETRNKRSVWTIAASPFPGSHFAVFPPALVEPCILAGCPVGGTVIDPFLGAGTTALVADRLGRSAIGIELNPAYAAMARRRIEGDAGMFFEAAE